MFKGIKTAIAVALSIGGLGTAVTLSAVAASPKEEQVARAATYEYDVYVDIQGAHSDYDAGDVYCHNWDGGSGTTWPGTKMTQVEGSLYGVNINSGNKKCIFNAGQGKSQTSDLDVTNHKVYLLNTNEWTDIHHYIDGSDQSPSNSTTRVFINNSDLGNWNSSGAQTMVRAWGSSSYSFDAAIYNLNWFENSGTGASGKWYGYADIPADVSGWQVVRINPNCYRRIWNFGPNGDVSSGGSARIYDLDENGWDFYWNGNTSDSGVGETFAAKIFEAYNTCSSSDLNGYGAYSSLKANFFDYLTNNAKTSSCKSLGSGINFTVNEHVSGMASRASGSPSNMIKTTNENKNIGLISIISILVLGCSFGAFFLLRKKRKQY